MWVCYTSSCLFHTVAATNHQFVGDIFWGWLNHYLIIIIILPLARMGSESIAHLAFVTKNRCVTHVKIRGYANLVSSLLAYLISAVPSRFGNSILSRSRMLLKIACYCNVTLFSIAGKF